jgi:DNA (cytosine-5)-methyltransferase 1
MFIILKKHDNGNTLKKVKEILESYNYNFFHKVLNASDFGIPQSRRRTFMVCFAKKLKVKTFHFPKPIEKEICLSDVLEKNVDINIKNIDKKKIKLKKNIFTQDLLFNFIPKQPIRIGDVDKGGQGNRIYDPRGHGITLSAYGGGTGAKTGLYMINKQIRKLTPRECARISGFPEKFQLSKNKNTSYKQFGNTVVIDVIQHIIKKIVIDKILTRIK